MVATEEIKKVCKVRIGKIRNLYYAYAVVTKNFGNDD